jgi:hypothetical protein
VRFGVSLALGLTYLEIAAQLGVVRHRVGAWRKELAEELARLTIAPE